ncbi:hypothetical protein A2415_00195 [candidate division WWE3 bacterium RIFOXYC1_FULL_39_7]|uniref:Uncharacterized protein n=1 Tax=candidate division WWE3 bacterium RIFOXYC1_FULL_39_7 TaxID=1802643 RepID=A0A1F4WIC5_UNCKA|nr:MAG: hypothetical protein A2415_00195 [candidate division WWE3 bacterium RIFOXYC1_FULL_39_7]
MNVTVESKLEEFKQALGKTGKVMTDEEILKLKAFFESLVEGWLDQCEIGIFGKTILDLTNETKPII